MIARKVLGRGGSGLRAVALGVNQSPWLYVYRLDQDGWGPLVPSPVVFGGARVDAVAFSLDGGHVVGIGNGVGYELNAAEFSIAGLVGAVLEQPLYDADGESARRIVFHPSGAALFVPVSSADGSLAAYQWDNGFGGRYGPIPTGTVGTLYSVAVSPDGAAVMGAGGGSPYVHAFAWDSSTGFGAKFSNPGVGTFSSIDCCAFSPTGGAAVFGHGSSSPYVLAIRWSGAGFGAAYSAPATAPTGTVEGVSFSPDGAFIALTHTTSPFVSIYPWTDAGGFGVKAANPADLAAGNGLSSAWTPDGRFFVMTHSGSPYVTAWEWSGSGFGAKLPAPSDALPAAPLHGIAVI